MEEIDLNKQEQEAADRACDVSAAAVLKALAAEKAARKKVKGSHAVVYRLSDAGQAEPVGVLRLSEGRVVADPADDPTLNGILATAVRDPETKRGVTAESDPEAWLRALPGQYRSAYLWIKVEEGE